MIDINRNKPGFSLIEALVSMLILSTFFAATAKVWSKREKPEKPRYPHGYFECYYDGTTLKEGIGREQHDPVVKNAGTKCTFESQGHNIIYKVIIVYSTPNSYDPNTGCGGDTKMCGGFTESIPFISGSLSIIPPKTSPNTAKISNTSVTNSVTYSLPGFKNMTYAQLSNHINFTNPKNNLLKQNAGKKGYNGGVIISW